MAFIVLVINVPAQRIQSLNDKPQFPTKSDAAINGASDLLGAILGGATNASVQITTRDSDPGVSTSGSQSEQNTYNKL